LYIDSMWKMYESSDSPGHLRHEHLVTEDNIDVIKHLPLSAACFMDQPVTVISELLNAFPDDVRKKDSFQRTALHWAARYSTYPEVVAELMNANIEASREQDKDGKIPLDLVDHWINDCLVAGS
jgi:ankyrin repeat protein